MSTRTDDEANNSKLIVGLRTILFVLCYGLYSFKMLLKKLLQTLL